MRSAAPSAPALAAIRSGSQAFGAIIHRQTPNVCRALSGFVTQSRKLAPRGAGGLLNTDDCLTHTHEWATTAR